ncbi:MAG: hypothetical protein Q7U74_09360 [Saprospiraceae bacterium]|nr:hypothetical protein [Saprospiraceae bacterium]
MRYPAEPHYPGQKVFYFNAIEIAAYQIDDFSSRPLLDIARRITEIGFMVRIPNHNPTMR